MRKSSCLIMAILMLLGAYVFGQLGGVEIPQLFMKSRYPIPDWVKPGLVAVYKYEGGSRTVTDTGEASGFYGNGYAFMLVTNVSRYSIYGIMASYMIYPQLFLDGPRVMPLYGSIYADPREIMEMVKQKEDYREQGIEVSGGNAGSGLVFLKVVYKDTTYAITVDSQGRVLKMSSMSKTPQGSSVVDLSLMGFVQANIPVLNTFPGVASENHVYALYSYSQMAGIGVPGGTVEISLKGNQGFLNSYVQTFNNPQMPFPMTYTVYGLPLYGPHYVSPEFLRMEVVLDIPDIGLRWYNQPSEYGGVDSVISVNGQNISISSYDDRGLLIKFQVAMGDMITTGQLQY